MLVLEPEGTLLQSLSSSWGRWVGEFTFTPEEVIHMEHLLWSILPGEQLPHAG